MISGCCRPLSAAIADAKSCRMLDDPTSSEDSLPLADAREIDKICRQFEAAFRSGQCPKTEDYLGDTPEPRRSHLQRELLAIEQELAGSPRFQAIHDELLASLVDLGLIGEADLRRALDSLPAGEQGLAGVEVVRLLCQRGQLTQFQADAVCRGRVHELVFGNYLLLHKLGRGGMGQVYKARHRRMDRVVAIKTMLSESSHAPESIQRFQREVRAAARLVHPNVVTAYDADEAGGVPFLVMEYVEGRDLGSLVREQGPLSVAMAVNYILQAARGLEYAHRQGVLHRDIKPSNLLVDCCGTVKILDMGLARSEAAGAVAAEGVTDGGQVLGTLDYLSPEQALDPHRVDARTDIYSLGCTLHYLLLGKPPYGGDTPVKKLLAHREQPIASLRVERPDVPGALDELFQKMVAKEPDGRPQSMSDVIAALETHVRVELVQFGTAGQLAGAAVSSPGADVLDTFDASNDQVEEQPIVTPTVNLGGLAESTSSSPQRGRNAKVPTLAPRGQRRNPFVRTAVLGAAAILLGMIVYVATDYGTIKIDVSDADAQIVVKVDGVEIQAWDGPLRLRATQHGLEIRGKTIETVSRSFTVLRGPNKALVVELTPKESAPDLASQPEAERKGGAKRGDQAPRSSDAGDGSRASPIPVPKRDRDSGNSAQLLAQLEAEIRAGVPDNPADPRVDRLRGRLLDLSRQRRGTADAVSAAVLMAKLPWPADALKREAIDRYELAVAGNGDESRAPPSLVAVLGETRLSHWAFACSVAFSPDDRFLVTTSTDRTVRIWEVGTGRQSKVLIGHAGPVWSAEFSPDGQIIASAGVGPDVRLWSAATGEPQGILVHGPPNVHRIVFSPDGQTLASAGEDARVILWDIAKKRQRREPLQEHKATVWALAFSKDGKWLASAGLDRTVCIWDAQSGKLVQRLSQHTGPVYGVAFSPVSDVLATASADKTIKFWQVSSQEVTAQPLRTLVDSAGVWRVRFSSDGKVLATTSEDHTIKFRILDDPSGARVFPSGNLFFQDIAFSHDGRRLAAGNITGSVQMFDVTTGMRLLGDDEQAHGGIVRAALFTADGKTILSGSADGTIRLWGASSGKQQHVITTFDPRSFGVRDLAICSENRTVFGCFQGSRTSWKQFDLRTGVQLASAGGYWCWSTSVSPDGKFVATGNRPTTGDRKRHTVAVWETRTWKELPPFSWPELDAYCVSFSPDSQLLAAAFYDGTVSLWDVSRGEKRLTFPAHRSPARSVAFSADGRYLVTAGNDSFVRLWDLATRRCVRTLECGSPVLCAKFSPDARVLAGSPDNGTVRLWDSETGSPLKGGTLFIGPPGGVINRFDFSPDGRHLVTANQNGTLYVLRLRRLEEERQEWSAKGFASCVGTKDGLGARLAGVSQSDAPPWAVAPFSEAQAKSDQQAWAKRLGVPVEVSNTIGMKLILIPPGEFVMGIDAVPPDEAPAHVVQITRPLRIGAHEVTVGQFRAFIHASGYRVDARKGAGNVYGFDTQSGLEVQDPKYNWEQPGYPQTDQHPVACISWNDAVAFCHWLSEKEGGTYRLPTEAEWEFVCRAGTESRYAGGDETEHAVANVYDATLKERYPTRSGTTTGRDGFLFAAPVGSFRSNAFRLFDMTGNVSEYCWDWYAPDYYGRSPTKNPQGPETGGERLIRGGGWNGICRISNRSMLRPDRSHYHIGFRVVREGN